MFHNSLYNRMFNQVLNFSAVLRIDRIRLLIPVAFVFKMREISAKHLFNIVWRLDE